MVKREDWTIVVVVVGGGGGGGGDEGDGKSEGIEEV